MNLFRSFSIASLGLVKAIVYSSSTFSSIINAIVSLLIRVSSVEEEGLLSLLAYLYSL